MHLNKRDSYVMNHIDDLIEYFSEIEMEASEKKSGIKFDYIKYTYSEDDNIGGYILIPKRIHPNPDSDNEYDFDEGDLVLVCIKGDEFLYIGTSGCHGFYGTKNVHYCNSDGSTSIFADETESFKDNLKLIKITLYGLISDRFH